MKQLIFDVETQKTFDQVGGYYPEKLGVSFIGAIERDGLPEKGDVSIIKHQIFEKDIKSFLPLLEQVDVVIGFNSDGFDLPTLTPYYSGDVTLLPSLDLMDRIKKSCGRRIGLNALATQTLGAQKSGNGLDAIDYFNKGEWEKLAKYCMQDVELTLQLYDYGRQHGHVKFLNKWNNLTQVDVDFNFIPPAKSAAVQLGLL